MSDAAAPPILNDDLIEVIFQFFGKDNYLFLAPVCKQWRLTYRRTFQHGDGNASTTTSYRNATRYIWMTKEVLVSSEPRATGRRSARNALCLSLIKAAMGNDNCFSTTQWLYATNLFHDIHYDFHVCKHAACNGRLRVLKWMQAQTRCIMQTAYCWDAATGGHLLVLKWLRANGCDWHHDTCYSAARGGHLAVLQWARANGCPWCNSTCNGAAEGGHLEVLKWAKANGCRWSKGTCTNAAKGGHLEVLKWAIANGCDCDIDGTRVAATKNRHFHIVAWVYGHCWDAIAAGGGRSL